MTTSQKNSSRIRSAAALLLVSLGTLLLMVGMFTAYLKLQLLDTDVWEQTSRAAVEQEPVRTAVATWSVDTLFDQAEPAAAIADLLPPRAAPIAGIVESQLRLQAYGIAERALESDRLQDAWVASNRRAHERFRTELDARDGGPLALVRSRTDAAATSDGLLLDLAPLLEQLAGRIGVDPAVIEQIPDTSVTIASDAPSRVDRG